MPGILVTGLVAFDRASIVSPAVRLSAAHVWTSGLIEPGGTAALKLELIGLDLCPIALRSRIWSARGCAFGQAGALSASGTHTFSPRSTTRPFASLGGSALLDAALPASLDAEFAVNASRALIRDELAFGPNVFHRVPPLILGFAISAGVRFR
jgi:hypothetical protein